MHILHLMGDGAVKVVTVRNCYINWGCCFGDFIKFNYYYYWYG